MTKAGHAPGLLRFDDNLLGNSQTALMGASTSARTMMLMEAPATESTPHPALVAIGIITLFVLLSISGYLVLSAS
jgi:hypothetical protein